MLHKKAFFITVLCLMFIHSYSQDQVLFQPITVNFNNISIDSALNIIENKIDYNFTYNSIYAIYQKPLNAKFTNVPLSIVLDSIFRNPYLTYKIIDKQLVIFKQEPDTLFETKPLKERPNTPSNYTINGRIIDSKSKENIPYASIGFLNKNRGTISNDDGNFSLTYNDQFLNDTLLIGHLGYRKLAIPVSELKSDSTYKLEQQSISLQEVVIRSSDPRSLIRQALESKSKNYDTNPFVHRAFYRETVKRNDRYMVYTEALFDIFKTAYRPTLFDDQLKLIKQRKFTDVISKDTVLFKLQGGLSTSLMLDVIKHPINFLDENHLFEYDYFIRDMVIVDNDLAYLIEFRPNKMSNDMEFTGEIYLNINTLAIVKVNFNFTHDALKKLKNTFILKQSKAIKAHPFDSEYSVTYKKSINGLYYINHIQGCLKLKVKRKRKLLSSTYQTSFEMISTDINTRDVSRFSRKETMNSNKIFSDLTDTYNLQFWVNENIIIPEEDLSKALQHFRQEDLSLEKK